MHNQSASTYCVYCTQRAGRFSILPTTLRGTKQLAMISPHMPPPKFCTPLPQLPTIPEVLVLANSGLLLLHGQNGHEDPFAGKCSLDSSRCFAILSCQSGGRHSSRFSTINRISAPQDHPASAKCSWSPFRNPPPARYGTFSRNRGNSARPALRGQLRARGATRQT